MSLELKQVNKQKAGFFRFKKMSKRYLITNDTGDYCFLDPSEFDSFLAGKIEQTHSVKYSDLQTKGFIRDSLDFDGLSEKYAKKNMFLSRGPGLHIIVVTLKCDHKCIYCQAGSQSLDAVGLDMDISTAQKVVDRIFESPSHDISIEFQGGEPLANWPTIKFIVEYAKKKNKIVNKNLLFSLVSNLTFMNQERLKFFIRNNVSICTSLDGSMELHDKNRPIIAKNKSSYKNTVKWIKTIQKEAKKNKRYQPRVNALITITSNSLRYARKIIDEYLRLGLEGVHLRPVNSFGINKKIWQKIAFTPDAFLKFYKEALDYIIELNFKGKKIYERTALIFLAKILTEKDPNFLDMRSPCGAGIGQIAYNFNGDVYTCDEARMLSRLGDESFRMGNVKHDSYSTFIDSEAVKTLTFASCLDNLPGCSNCVYKSYCGVCPVCNHAEEGNIFNQNMTKCKIYRSILDYLFEKMQKANVKDVFYSWLKD